jgi:hypothetical protein
MALQRSEAYPAALFGARALSFSAAPVTGRI